MDIEPGISEDYVPMDSKRLLERLHTALNSRDLENFLRCFQVDYESNLPARPSQDYIGLSMLRAEWETTFTEFPDFKADLIHSATNIDTIWSEWHWLGHQDGTELNRVGVIIFGIENGLIAWGRSYMEDLRTGDNRSDQK